MYEFLPIIIVGAIIGAFSILFIMAYIALNKSKEEKNKDRNMSDGELVKRLLSYAKPFWKQFVVVLFLMIFSIAYDIVSPLIIGEVQDLVKADFALENLYKYLAVYVSILIVSMICTYLQSIILQKVGQQILSDLRMDIFTHIESLSHEQLNNIPVGKLVTRVTNDTNSISMMFTNVLVTMAKNSMVIVGVLGGMLMLNYALTLMVLCFVPFVVLFTVIFRKFSRTVHRNVNDARTDINTYLSENLSGIKITQIFNREEQKMNDFLKKSYDLQKAKQQQIYVFGIFRPMVYMLHISATLCLFYLGGKGVITDFEFMGQSITSAIVVSFYLYISKFFNPIQTLAEQFDVL
ncbi:MAG: ABC transporter ATP-binding protein, partial [Agathobacter sp.]|nr:ABC transporter ATP-binding protein [Agathobacter sp.]